MASFSRRAYAAIMRILASAADPSTDAKAGQLYAKTLSGSLQLFGIDSSGLVYQGTPYLGLCKNVFYLGDDFGTSAMSTFTVSGGTAALATAVQGAPGNVTMSMSTVGSRIAITPAVSVLTSMIVGGNVIIFEGRCRTPTVQDGTDQWSDRWGMADNTGTGDAVDGIYFESDRNVNGDNNVRLCTSTGSTRTKTTMGIAPTANTFERWKWILNAVGTSVQGYLNDTANGTAVTTNIPTAALTASYHAQTIKTLGVNTRTVDRDYLESTQIFSPTMR